MAGICDHSPDAQDLCGKISLAERKRDDGSDGDCPVGPGAIAVNAAILVGYRIAGVVGALITVLGTVLPPMVILSVISLFYEAFRSNLAVSMVMQGMAAGVVAVIFDVVLVMAQTLWQQRRAIWMVLLAVCFVASMLGVGAAPLVLACGCIGMVDTLRPRKERGKEGK